MRSFVLAAVLSAAALSFPAHAKLKVVATVSDLGAITSAVGGDLVSVETLSRSTQDPHFADAKPSLILSLARADLLVLNGMDLEVGWLPVMLTGSRNAKVQRGEPGYLDCSTLITPREVPIQKLDRSMGDIHPGGNPHYTKDPRNAALVARGIADRLSQLDPSHHQQYAANAARFQQALQAKMAEWSKALAPLKGRPVVTYHKSWIYFVDFAGMVEVAFVEPKPGIPPNPAHVTNVLNVIRARDVKVILQEQWYPAATSELLVKNSRAKLVRVPGMTPEGSDYLSYMDGLVRATISAFQAAMGSGAGR
ncbi:MAG TPA: metal ABC transporter substrate-binding protein [Gemmatimonadales bacterium]|nr:metal ABC transporter substrate-binding protein [Gemmatimonadales bacterium]